MLSLLLKFIAYIIDYINKNKTKFVVIFGIAGFVSFILGIVNLILLGQRIEEDCKNEAAKKTCYDKRDSEYFYLYIYFWILIILGLVFLLIGAWLAYLKYDENK